MKYEIAISPLAKEEILEAYDWYELGRQGLGDEFLLDIENFFATLLQNPKTYSYYQKPVRDGVVKKISLLSNLRNSRRENFNLQRIYG